MVRLTTLGGLALLGEHGPVSGSAARGRNLALLALLARAGAAGMSRDKLAALLWAESDQERARHSLDQAVYTIRRALGADALVTGATTVALGTERVAVDVVEFADAIDRGRLAEAVDLYGGPFLDGFHLSEAAELERWIDEERADLERRLADALDSLAVASAEEGELDAVVRYRRHAAGLQPLSARRALDLMRALEAAGDRTGALEAARIHAALVRQELGVAPDPSIRGYEEELRGAPAPSVARRESAGGVGAAAAATADATAGPPPAIHPESARPSPSRPTWKVALPVAAAVLAVVVATVLLRPGVTPGAVALPRELPRVVVLPFDNETGDAALSPAGSMAADWITEGLVRTGLVRVVEKVDGADGVVSGRVYLEGDSLWLHARVTSAADGLVLRALERVPAAPDNPSQALEPLRQGVLGALGTLYDPRLAAWQGAVLRPPSYDAYRELANGLELFAMPRDLPGARARFRASAVADPGFAMPRLWLAWASLMEGDFAAADSAVTELDDWPDLSPMERAWHDRIVAVLRGDDEASFRAAGRMVELVPRSGWVIALANAALDTHRPAVAVTALENAGMQNLGVEAGYGWFLMTAALHGLGRYEDELASAREGIRTVGDGWGFVGPGVSALAALGRVEELERRLDELEHAPPLDGGAPAGPTALGHAVLELRAHGHEAAADALVERRLDGSAPIELLYEIDRLSDVERRLAAGEDGEPRWTPLGRRGMAALIAARRGRRDEAALEAERLAGTPPPYSFGESAYWAARVEAVLGRGDRAIRLLRRAFAEGQGAPTWDAVHLTRDFDDLRDGPSFRELVRPRPVPAPLSNR